MVNFQLYHLKQTEDGFYIAEKDLEIRGPGEFLGMKQSGLVELHLADLTKDLYILEMARNDAKEYVNNHYKDDYPQELQKYLDSSLPAVLDMNFSD